MKTSFGRGSRVMLGDRIGTVVEVDGAHRSVKLDDGPSVICNKRHLRPTGPSPIEALIDSRKDAEHDPL